MHWLLWVDLLDMGFVKGSESDCAHTYGLTLGFDPRPTISSVIWETHIH